jgi:hypothetical protein
MQHLPPFWRPVVHRGGGLSVIASETMYPRQPLRFLSVGTQSQLELVQPSIPCGVERGHQRFVCFGTGD